MGKIMGQTSAGRVLVVEDDAITLKNLRNILRKEGYEVILYLLMFLGAFRFIFWPISQLCGLLLSL